MKKTFFALALLAFAAMPVCAQDDDEIDHSMEFVDAEGNIVPDGSIVNRTETEYSDFDELQISSGLYAKNTTDEVVNISFTAVIESQPSGTFQHCFPGSCMRYDAPQTNRVIDRPVGGADTAREPGSSASLQSEWLVEEGNYGTCVVSYQFGIYGVNPVTYDWMFYGNGPKVTVNYIYADPAGVDVNVADKMLRSIKYYDLSGREVSKPANGVYVKKLTYGDGSVKTSKVAVE